MGARVARMFRNFDIENRAQREISKEKPRVAPRHAAHQPPTVHSSEVAESVKQKNEPLLAHLRNVYVESKDPAAAAAELLKEVTAAKEVERRPLNVSVPASLFSLADLTDVPKGKLTILEALKALGNHQHRPQQWTPEKIAQEYSLDLKDTKALLEFFIPFQVEVIAPKTETDEQKKESKDKSLS